MSTTVPKPFGESSSALQRKLPAAPFTRVSRPPRRAPVSSTACPTACGADDDQHVTPRDRARDATERELRELVRLLVRAAGQARGDLERRLERVVVGVGHVEREETRPRGGQTAQGRDPVADVLRVVAD